MKEHRLLIVDDDTNILELVKDIGENLGFAVTTTVQTSDFQRLYPEIRPTLIMLDLTIGENDGIEILRYLSSNGCKIPIIMLSGHDAKVCSTAFRLGNEYGLTMVTHLQKPIDLDVLIKFLEENKTKRPFVNIDNLKKGIENNELRLHYQPIISVKSKEVLGVEALVRWQPPDHELIPPDQFISFAEESGMIEPLTFWVIETAFKQSALWAKNKLPLNININLSATLLTNLKLPDEFLALAKKHGTDPKKICFEVTETGVMTQAQVATDILTRLRLKDFSLALDDFGTGYSSLVQLYRLPFREIKIDKSFVLNVTKDQECLSIVNSIITLGHSLKMEVVAEGVETKAIWHKLQELTCDVAQGYYIEHTIPGDTFEGWLALNTDGHMIFKEK